MTDSQQLGLRARRRFETHREVQAALLSLLEERALSDVTVAEVAERAGISPRTFFRYFESKEAALLPGTAEVEQILKGLTFTRGGSVDVYKELLRQLRSHFDRAHIPDQDVYLQVQRLMESEPTLRRYVGAQEMWFVDELTRVVGDQSGLPPMEAGVVAESALAVWRITWREWGVALGRGKRQDPAKIFDEVLDSFSGLSSSAIR